VHGRTRPPLQDEEGVDAIAKMFQVIPPSTPCPSRDRIGGLPGLRRVGIGVIRAPRAEYQDWRPSLLADRCSIKFSARYSRTDAGDGRGGHPALIARMQKDDPDLVRTCG